LSTKKCKKILYFYFIQDFIYSVNSGRLRKDGFAEYFLQVGLLPIILRATLAKGKEIGEDDRKNGTITSLLLFARASINRVFASLLEIKMAA
jgi:hypothetical protein